MKAFKALKEAFGNSRMFLMLVFGMSCGLPYILTKTPLAAWMTQENVSLKTIGLFALAGMPYTLKFLWAPLVDRYIPPFLGRRRGWALIFQLLLVLALVGLSLLHPVGQLSWVALVAVLISFFGASQDIVVDAYRAELWEEKQLGAANSVHIAGYLMSIRWIGNAIALLMADYIGWPNVFRVMAVIQLTGAVASLMAPEPPASSRVKAPRTLRESILDPLMDFLKRKGAVEILLFILLYKLGENIAGVMFTPYYLKMGFEQKIIGAVAKPVGFFATLGGTLLGGVLMVQLGTRRALWFFGVCQALSTLFFSVLLYTGRSVVALACVVGAENLAVGMGTAAFATFMMALCNRRFTATQYALLTSLMAVPANLLGASSGYLAEGLGWQGFFVFCTLIAVPGLLMLLRFDKWETAVAN